MLVCDVDPPGARSSHRAVRVAPLRLGSMTQRLRRPRTLPARRRSTSPFCCPAGTTTPSRCTNAVELQRASYELGSDDASRPMITGSGHQIMLETQAPLFRAGLSSWLAALGSDEARPTHDGAY